MPMRPTYPHPWRARADMDHETASVLCSRAGQVVVVAAELSFAQATAIAASSEQHELARKALEQCLTWFTSMKQNGGQPPVLAVRQALEAMKP